MTLEPVVSRSSEYSMLSSHVPQNGAQHSDQRHASLVGCIGYTSGT